MQRGSRSHCRRSLCVFQHYIRKQSYKWYWSLVVQLLNADAVTLKTTKSVMVCKRCVQSDQALNRKYHRANSVDLVLITLIYISIFIIFK